MHLHGTSRAVCQCMYGAFRPSQHACTDDEMMSLTIIRASYELHEHKPPGMAVQWTDQMNRRMSGAMKTPLVEKCCNMPHWCGSLGGGQPADHVASLSKLGMSRSYKDSLVQPHLGETAEASVRQVSSLTSPLSGKRVS